jgi:phage baseplate assembly protein W
MADAFDYSSYSPSITPPQPGVPLLDAQPDPASPWRQAKLGDYRAAPDDAVGRIVSDIDDVHQCIRIILTTPKGSDPYRPDFAIDYLDYLDWPINKATPYIVRGAMKAVLTWEPRVEVTKIGVRPEADYAKSWIEIHWRLKDPPRQTLQHITEVQYGSGYL